MFSERNMIRIETLIIVLVVLGILYLLFKTSKEHFADNILNIDTIRDEINKQYNMDIEAMRNLGAISKSLLTGTNYHSTTVGTPGTLTIPADNTNLMGGLTVNGGSTVNGELTIAATIKAPGRMHISGNELLYLLNKNGVIISGAWGGNGNLTVEGALNVGGYNVQNKLTDLQNQINNIIPKGSDIGFLTSRKNPACPAGYKSSVGLVEPGWFSTNVAGMCYKE